MEIKLLSIEPMYRTCDQCAKVSVEGRHPELVGAFESQGLHVKKCEFMRNQSVLVVDTNRKEQIEKVIEKACSTPVGFIDLGLPSGRKWAFHNAAMKDYAQAQVFNLPTIDDYHELIEICHWYWQMSGYMVVGPNGKSVFFPHLIDQDGRNIDYWTKDNREGSVRTLSIDYDWFGVSWTRRSYECLIREVI